MKSFANYQRLAAGLYAVTAILLISCGNGQPSAVTPFYGAADYLKVKKTDVHAHIFRSDSAIYEQALKDNVALITINVESPGAPPIDSQQYFALRQQQISHGDVHWMATFGSVNINEPGWAGKELSRLQQSFDSGALGIKVWKNIGMTVKDKNGKFIMVNDAVFDPIFNYLEKNNIPVLGHLGEPKNCWLPLEKMTTNNDRNYFKEHPQYHMFLHPDYPSYDSIISARDRLLDKHPKLKFIGAHLASLEWSVDEMAKHLDKYPNMAIELAARMGQVQYQTLTDYNKVRDFFIKYQDRIMYGTDLGVVEGNNADTIKEEAHTTWLRDWNYLTSADSLQTPFLDTKIKGLQLPKETVDRIYYKNVEQFFGIKLK